MSTIKVNKIICDFCPKNSKTQADDRCYVCGNDMCHKHKHFVKYYFNMYCEPYIIIHQNNDSFTICPSCHEKMIKYDNKLDKKRKGL